MPIPADVTLAALSHLRQADSVLAQVIDEVGPFGLRPERNRFGILARSIISQQVSTAAARSIRQRLDALLAPRSLSPESVAARNIDELRTAGLSARKAEYLLDLARRELDGSLGLRTMGRLSDEQIIRRLVEVRGIGVWTAQMFLIFALGRPDVFPVEDLGVRAALKMFYRLDELPRREEAERIAAPWRPYATFATWYCWRGLERRRSQPQAPAGYPV